MNLRGGIDRATPGRLPGEGHAAAPARGIDPELVVQVKKVLLDRCVGDHELLRDLTDGRRFGEAIVGQHRPAQRRQYVAFAASQLGQLVHAQRILTRR